MAYILILYQLDSTYATDTKPVRSRLKTIDEPNGTGNPEKLISEFIHTLLIPVC